MRIAPWSKAKVYNPYYRSQIRIKIIYYVLIKKTIECCDIKLFYLTIQCKRRDNVRVRAQLRQLRAYCGARVCARTDRRVRPRRHRQLLRRALRPLCVGRRLGRARRGGPLRRAVRRTPGGGARWARLLCRQNTHQSSDQSAPSLSVLQTSSRPPAALQHANPPAQLTRRQEELRQPAPDERRSPGRAWKRERQRRRKPSGAGAHAIQDVRWIATRCSTALSPRASRHRWRLGTRFCLRSLATLTFTPRIFDLPLL